MWEDMVARASLALAEKEQAAAGLDKIQSGPNHVVIDSEEDEDKFEVKASATPKEPTVEKDRVVISRELARVKVFSGTPMRPVEISVQNLKKKINPQEIVEPIFEPTPKYQRSCSSFIVDTSSPRHQPRPYLKSVSGSIFEPTPKCQRSCSSFLVDTSSPRHQPRPYFRSVSGAGCKAFDDAARAAALLTHKPDPSSPPHMEKSRASYDDEAGFDSSNGSSDSDIQLWNPGECAEWNVREEERIEESQDSLYVRRLERIKLGNLAAVSGGFRNKAKASKHHDMTISTGSPPESPSFHVSALSSPTSQFNSYGNSGVADTGIDIAELAKYSFYSNPLFHEQVQACVDVIESPRGAFATMEANYTALINMKRKRRKKDVRKAQAPVQVEAEEPKSTEGDAEAPPSPKCDPRPFFELIPFEVLKRGVLQPLPRRGEECPSDPRKSLDGSVVA